MLFFILLTWVVQTILCSPLQPRFSAASTGQRFWEQLVEVSWWWGWRPRGGGSGAAVRGAEGGRSRYAFSDIQHVDVLMPDTSDDRCLSGSPTARGPDGQNQPLEEVLELPMPPDGLGDLLVSAKAPLQITSPRCLVQRIE
ncbi:MAG: hypothetical protein ACRYHQ_26725 [Janthinobacterium lividum]